MSDPIVLDERQQRVIGVLIEKSLATPQYYPLTLNQVVTGCNQKSNREPVVSWMEDEVDDVLTNLARVGFASQVHAAGSRVGKWRQELTGQLGLSGQAMAVVAELLLRGPQTLGELRTRASRMKDIPDLAILEQVLADLAGRQPALAARFSPDGVRRGVRWGHLLQSQQAIQSQRVAQETGVTFTDTPASPGTSSMPNESLERVDRLDQLEEMVRKLLERIEALERNQT